MTNEEVLNEVKSIMDTLEIEDEDVRQEIYLNALQNIKMCEDHNSILLEIINPILYKHFNELQEINRRFVSYKSLDKINKDNMIYDMINSRARKNNMVKRIYCTSKNLGPVHTYIISEHFLKQTDLDDMAKVLNISRESVELIIDEVISDIKSVLNIS